MKQFLRINNITGWVVFALAAWLYLYTMEPTVSLWDCGEFISSAYKLEVGHPPGAPFYLMLARIFALIAPEKEHVAMCINALSALASAFTVLFLFWTITHLMRRMFANKESLDKWDTVKIIGSGAVGALTFCFSDSFWFSAAEAEVYALSSLFTALVFWCVLKWEEDPGPFANRWLILIAYLMGISIGVHLLNLLAIPAVVMIISYKKYGTGWKKVLLALVVSFLLLISILYVIIPGTVKLAAAVEILFVNFLHFQVNVGLAFFLVSGIFIFLLISLVAHHKGKKVLNFLFLFLTVFFIGYGSYAMIVIRASANTPLNTGNPSNVFSLLSYLNRDQYGDRPLVYGQYFNAPVVKNQRITVQYKIKDGKYVKTFWKTGFAYHPGYMTFFPRMYSSHPDHIKVYKDWGTIGTKKVANNDGTAADELDPDFFDNVEFFFSYQIGYMYLRYFMWNFAGKQNDMQGNGGIMKGNWISGFDFIDRWMIGPQKLLPGYMKDNPGRNRYFLLPLLLGVLGAIFHYKYSRRYFSVITFLFILTGLAIVIYTNQTPLQPRERDYVYVGSFFAFCIWIGFGTLAMINMFQKKFNHKIVVFAGLTSSLAIPVMMLIQNFDDHNRHGRVMARNIAYNYLNSCAANAILFTRGDNDTYPLWYLQEVEGVRTDVRVINLMLLNTSWYVAQQRNKIYTSDPVPATLPDTFYQAFNRIPVKHSDKPINIKQNMQNIGNINVIEDYLLLNYNNDSINIKISKAYVLRSELFVLDFLSSFNWKRPVYFTAKKPAAVFGIEKYLQPEGFIYRLTPDSLSIEKYISKPYIEKNYINLMQTAVWDERRDGKGMIDDHLRTILAYMQVRQRYAKLAHALLDEGKRFEAKQVLDRAMEIMPPYRIPCDQNCILLAKGYFRSEENIKGDEIISLYENQLKEELNFYNHLPHWMNNWVAKERTEAEHLLENIKNVKSNMRNPEKTSF